MIEISIHEAYAEACRVIGEQVVERRLLAAQQSGVPEERNRAYADDVGEAGLTATSADSAS